MVFIHAPVGKDKDIRPFPVYPVHLHKQPLDGPLQACIFIINNGHYLYFEALRLHALNLDNIRIGEDGIVHL